MFSLDELLSDYEAPEIGGEISEPGGAEFTGIDFDFETEEEPPEIDLELDYKNEPLEFLDLEDLEDFEDLDPEELEETEVIKSPEKEEK